MNAAHLHLLLNHLPVIGTIAAILLLAYALFRRSPEMTRAAAGAFVLLGITGIIVFLTGEPAEEVVEELPGVSHDLIEQHEEAALLATALLGALGTAAAGGLFAFRKRLEAMPRGFAIGLLAASLLPAAAMGYTANLGGQIRHSEIRPAAELPAADLEQAEDAEGYDDSAEEGH